MLRMIEKIYMKNTEKKVKKDTEKVTFENLKKENHLEKLIFKLFEKVPQDLTGKSEIWLLKYRERYGEKDSTQMILSARLKLFKTYLLMGFGLFVLIFALVIDGLIQKQDLSSLERPKFGEPPHKRTLLVKATSGQMDVSVPLNISVYPKALRAEEKEKAITEYGNSLPEIIVGDNESLYRITRPLNLVDRDPITGITIEWDSENEDVISKAGVVNFLGLQGEERVVLQAEVILEDKKKIFYFPVVVVPAEESKDLKALLKSKVLNLKSILEQSSFESTLRLPERMDGYVQLKWQVKKDFTGQIMILILGLMAFQIYRTRFRSIDREIENGRVSIIENFPGMVNKLVLLLNAGLVLSGALDKIAGDYGKRKVIGKGENILYEEICEIERRVKETNSSLLEEMEKFSKRSGVRELMRFSAILSENVHKGAELSAKLESEAEMLWLSRKKRAEEKGRLAETKLALPLMFLLLVFILITITPALMEI